MKFTILWRFLATLLFVGAALVLAAAAQNTELGEQTAKVDKLFAQC